MWLCRQNANGPTVARQRSAVVYHLHHSGHHPLAIFSIAYQYLFWAVRLLQKLHWENAQKDEHA